MTKRKHMREADLLRVLSRDGRFVLNPLAWRNQGKFKRLEGLVKQGKLKKRQYKLDYVEYTACEPANSANPQSRLTGDGEGAQ